MERDARPPRRGGVRTEKRTNCAARFCRLCRACMHFPSIGIFIRAFESLIDWVLYAATFEGDMMANLGRAESTVTLYRQNLHFKFDDWLAPTSHRLGRRGRRDGRSSSSLGIGKANASQGVQGEPEKDEMPVALRPKQTKCHRHFVCGEWACHGWFSRPASAERTAERCRYLTVRRAPWPRSTQPIPVKLAKQAVVRADPRPQSRIGKILGLERPLTPLPRRTWRTGSTSSVASTTGRPPISSLDAALDLLSAVRRPREPAQPGGAPADRRRAARHDRTLAHSSTCGDPAPRFG